MRERGQFFSPENFRIEDPFTPRDEDPNPNIEHHDAFSRHTRRLIVERVVEKHGKPVSEISGRDDMPLQAAHINHDKKSPDYDNPDNGILMTVDEHLRDHISREGKNGLTIAGNKLAIELLSKQIEDLTDRQTLNTVITEALREKLLAPRPKRIPMGTGD